MFAINKRVTVAMGSLALRVGQCLPRATLFNQKPRPRALVAGLRELAASIANAICKLSACQTWPQLLLGSACMGRPSVSNAARSGRVTAAQLDGITECSIRAGEEKRSGASCFTVV